MSGWVWHKPVGVLCVWSTIRQAASDELFSDHSVPGYMVAVSYATGQF